MSSLLEIQVLGELTVSVEGQARPLPRSRKTRALIAYLAITARSHRREALCDLFWDVADDRRAALRWSLSKIRKTLGPDAVEKLAATRSSVALELSPGALDLVRLRRATTQLEDTATEALEELVAGWNGELLEGMTLPDFDAFEAFLLAERLRASAYHVQIRRALVQRLGDRPHDALVHARAWAGTDADDEEASEWVRRLSAALASGKPVSTPQSRTAELVVQELAPPVPALVGRDAELERIDALCATVRAQRTGRVLILHGEPGMGKTRLLEEVLWSHRDRRPAQATFHAVERRRPLAPFLDLFRDRSDLGTAQGDEARDRDMLFERIASAIRSHGDDQELGILTLDDAHLADPASCELVHYLVRTATRAPLLTILACRSAELEDNGPLTTALTDLRRSGMVEELTVRALDTEAARALAAPNAPHDRLDELVRESSGIPLVVLEMARAPADSPVLPQSLSDLVKARLSSLPDGVAAIARWVAVLESGPLALLEALAAPRGSAFVDAIEIAERYRFVRIDPAAPEARFRATHALVSRAVYESISAIRLTTMHRQAAEALGRGRHTTDTTASIAHHAQRANRPDLVADALIRGASRAAALGVAREARSMLEEALTLIAALEESSAVPLEIRARDLSLQLHRPEEPDRWVARLGELGLRALDLEKPSAASRAFRAAGRLRWETGDGPKGYGMARKALRTAAGRESGEHVRSSSMVALCLIQLEREFPAAQAMVQKAQALASARGDGHEPSELLLARSLLHLHAGELEDAARDAAEAQLAARSERRTVHEVLALQASMQIAFSQGHRTEALRAAEALAPLAERIREGPEGPMAAAVVALLNPDVAEGNESLRLVEDRLRELDDKRALAWVLNRWAERRRRLAEPGEAALLASEALQSALAVEAPSEAAIAASVLIASATTTGDEGRVAEARRALAELDAGAALSVEALEQIARLTSAATTEGES